MLLETPIFNFFLKTCSEYIMVVASIIIIYFRGFTDLVANMVYSEKNENCAVKLTTPLRVMIRVGIRIFSQYRIY